MPSNDVRILAQAAVPTVAVGAIATVVSGVVAGGKGAIGAGVATVVVIAFMGLGLYVLQRTARSLPHLFQGMGLLLYTTQILLLFVFLAAFKETTLFNPRAFAVTLLAGTLAWIGAQTRAHMKSKILYVEPEPSSSTTTSKGQKPATSGHSS
jgi:ATP synthase protein I